MKCPLFPGNVRMSLKEEKAGCTAMCRRQAADSQCNRPAGRVTADVCSKEKDDFCQETCECPLFPGNIRMSWKQEKAGCKAHVQTAGRREAMQSSGKKSDSRRVQQGKDDFCQETYEMPIVSWKYSHELEEEKAGCKGMCRRQAAVSQYSRPARRVTADVCSREKSTFARKLMKCPLFPGNIRMSLKERRRGAERMCRRQAADSQCNRPAGRVTGDVCSKDKDDFCQETCEMPIVSWKFA